MMSEEAKKLRNEYMRKWGEKNREKIKLYHELYWEKKAMEESEPENQTECIYCGQKFLAKRADARYCSSACRVKHHREAQS